MTPGALLLAARQKRGLTLRDVEAGCGFNNSQLARIEKGMVGLSLKTAITLCDFYGINLDTLAHSVREHRVTLPASINHDPFKAPLRGCNPLAIGKKTAP